MFFILFFSLSFLAQYILTRFPVANLSLGMIPHPLGIHFITFLTRIFIHSITCHVFMKGPILYTWKIVMKYLERYSLLWGPLTKTNIKKNSLSDVLLILTSDHLGVSSSIYTTIHITLSNYVVIIVVVVLYFSLARLRAYWK